MSVRVSGRKERGHLKVPLSSRTRPVCCSQRTHEAAGADTHTAITLRIVLVRSCARRFNSNRDILSVCSVRLRVRKEDGGPSPVFYTQIDQQKDHLEKFTRNSSVCSSGNSSGLPSSFISWLLRSSCVYQRNVRSVTDCAITPALLWVGGGQLGDPGCARFTMLVEPDWEAERRERRNKRTWAEGLQPDATCSWSTSSL